MKKSLMLLLCAGSVITANAQKNSVLLFGNFGATSVTNKSGSSTIALSSFGITPGLGYQVSDRWTIGIQGTFNYLGGYKTGIQYNENAHQIGIGGGLFARYSVPINKFLFFYTQAEGMYSVTRNFNQEYSTSNVHNLNLKISPNLGIKIKNGYAINIGFAGVGYNLQRYAGTSSSKVSFGILQGVTIGFSKNFMKRKKAKTHLEL